MAGARGAPHGASRARPGAAGTRPKRPSGTSVRLRRIQKSTIATKQRYVGVCAYNMMILLHVHFYKECWRIATLFHMPNSNIRYPSKAEVLSKDTEMAVRLRSEHEGSLTRDEKCRLDWIIAAYAKAEPVEASELESTRALMKRLSTGTAQPPRSADEP